MHQTLRLAVLSLVAIPAFAFAGDWEIDTAHSTAAFSIKHMMVANVRGTFDKVTGKVNIDDKNPTKSTVEATIDIASIDTGNTDRDNHLKAADFFDAEKNPTITFKSTKVTPGKGKGMYKVTGDLTMHGVTKPVTLDVEAPATEVKDPWGNVKRGATATTMVNRKDFGLTWNKALETGGVAVGDEVKITLDIEMNKAKPPETKPAEGMSKDAK